LYKDLFGFYLLFYGALSAGFLLRRWQGLAPFLMRYAILLLEAPIFAYSFWILDLQRVRQFAPIPLISVALVLTALGLGARLAPRLFGNSPARGSFTVAAGFSNIGTTGGSFLCYLLFGLPGLALGALYLLPYPFLVYTLGFSLARYYASGRTLPLREMLVSLLANAVSAVPLAGMGLGLACNLLSWPVPAGLTSVADKWIKLDLVVMCLAIGMTLKPRRLFAAWRPLAAIGAIKFILLPLLAAVLVWLSYGSWQSLPAKVLLVQASMPVAIYGVVTANLFGLDRELANTLWFSTTLLLAPVAAVLFLLLGA